MKRPIGYFVHHQGRGHAERAAAIANALIEYRSVTLFSAKSEIFPELHPDIEIVKVPSLFEATGREAPGLASLGAPSTVHCAPLGWPSITTAMATLTGWFAKAKPALFVTDVSAELAQLARLCSIPSVAVLQHGDRSDPGHVAAYESAVGLLAPYAKTLEQDDRPDWMTDKTHYAGGVGIDLGNMPSQAEARRKLGLSEADDIVLVVSGGGGEGTPSTPLTLGARREPNSRWFTIGKVRSEWHETVPGNLEHLDWVDNPEDWIAAADRIVSSCGNTTVHQIAALAKPWVVVPEWRYFDEQLCKAVVLRREGLAAVASHWPSHQGAWADLWALAEENVRKTRKAELIDPEAASKAAVWLDDLASELWAGADTSSPSLEVVA